MTTETVLARIVPGVEALLKEVEARGVPAAGSPTLYELEALTQGVMPRIGQLVLQELARAQGSGLLGPTRPCACGQQQAYRDRARPLSVQTSVGEIGLAQRAYYRCAGCGAASYPLDERLGLGQAGRMSRYLQEQCGWLLALLPGRVGRQTLVRFGWPAIAASQLREKAEALGAALDEQGQRRLAVLREAATLPRSHVAPRQPARSSRLYAAPDGLMYCTKHRDPQTGKLVWRELKAAAVFEAEPEQRAGPPAAARPSLRERLRTWLDAQGDGPPPALADRAVRISYVAQTAPYAQFGLCLWGELRERGLGCPVTDLAVVADGSPHLDQIVDSELRLPGIRLTRILDLPHAQGHLWAVSNAVFGEGSALARRWVQAPLLALERGQVDQVCAALEELAQTVEASDPAGAQRACQAAAYFDRRAAQLAYPDFLAAGYQLGSGLAERACKRFGTDRMKGAGMRWTVPGAQQVATLRMLLLSDRWQEVTDHCRAAA